MSTLVTSSIAVAAAAAPPSEVPSSTISPLETHEPQSVVHLKLISDDHDNHEYELEVLKPTRWAEDLVSAGGTTRLSLDELEVEGWATISSYRPIETSETPHQLVMMKLSHSSNDVYEVAFGDEVAPLRGTGSHPLYSLDRDDWVRVRDLRIGERLQTANGAVSVEALEKVRGTFRVYNLEVEEDHEYFAGEAGVRSHNSGALNCAKVPRYDGPKPKYHVNPAHKPGSRGFNPKKTPLPADAEDVFKNAVPDDPVSPRNWFGKNADGDVYRFSGGNDGTAHFSGSSGVGDGIRNLTNYAKQRLGL